MFNDKYGLTEAVLSGRKTMTRRIATALNHPLVSDISEWGNDDKGKAEIAVTYLSGLVHYVYPQYQPGEVVAVAQCYEDVNNHLGAMARCIINPFGSPREHPGWTNKMFVRAELMPHLIRITNIKAERLQDISDEDCKKEGIMEGEFMNTWDTFYFDEWGDVPNHITFPTVREAFAALIDRISGEGTWKRNPWVFAYEFEKID